MLQNQVLLLEDYLWKKENLRSSSNIHSLLFTMIAVSSDAWKYWKFALYNNSLRCYAPNEKVWSIFSF